mgnify:CR=1 FL=1
MTELTKGIFEVSKNVYKNNKGSILRTIAVSYTHLTLPTNREV